MEETQNVTLAIPKRILHKAKLLAVQRNTSLSALLTQTLETLILQAESYDEARQRSLETIREGFDLGTYGDISWKREDLHDR